MWVLSFRTYRYNIGDNARFLLKNDIFLEMWSCFPNYFFGNNFQNLPILKYYRNRKNVNQWFPRRGSIWIWSFWIRNDRFWFWWIWMDYYGFYDYYLYYNRFLYIWQEWVFDFFESVECVFIPLSVRVCSFKIFSLISNENI